MSRQDTFLGSAFSLVVTAQVAGENMVEDKLELRRGLFALGLAMRRAHLEILRGDAEISILRCLEETQHSIRGSVTSKRIVGSAACAWA